MEKVIITGGLGFIGSNLINILKNNIIIEPITDVKNLSTIKFENAIVDDENYFLKESR